MEDQFIPVLFLGNRGTYGIARAFHEYYGIKSVVIATVKTCLIASSSILDVHVIPTLNEHLQEGLLEAIRYVEEHYPNHKKIAIASEDTYVEHLVENRSLFPKDWTIPYINEDILHLSTNKGSFYQKLEELHLPYPETQLISGDQLPSDLKGSYVLKPALTPEYQNLHFEGKHKVFVSPTPKQAQENLNKMRNGGYRHEVILQRFIEGNDFDQAVVTAYRSPHDKKIKLFSFGRVLVEDHTPSSAGNHLAILTENHKDEIFKNVEKIMGAYDFIGFANFDLIYDHQQQTYLFFELNPRLGLSSFYLSVGGQNPAPFYIEDYLFGREVTPSFESQAGVMSLLPRPLLHHYLKGTSYDEKVKKLYSEKKVKNPIAYEKEKKLKHKLYALASSYKFYQKLSRKEKS